MIDQVASAFIIVQSEGNALLDPHFVLDLVVEEDVAGHLVGGRQGVGVAQQRANRNEDGPGVVNGAPLGGQNIKANAPVTVDVGVEHLALENDVWTGVGVVVGVGDIELENTSFPGSALGALDEGGCLEHVGLVPVDQDTIFLLLVDLVEVLLDPVDGHLLRHDASYKYYIDSAYHYTLSLN